MIRTSGVDNNNNIEAVVTCKACGHTCKEVYIVKNGNIQDVQEYGDKFVKTSEKVCLVENNNKPVETVYMCPNCGILQAEVSKV